MAGLVTAKKNWPQVVTNIQITILTPKNIIKAIIIKQKLFYNQRAMNKENTE